MDPNQDQTTNEAPSMRSKQSKSSGQPEPRAEMKIRKPEEDVLDVIESVESQLGALRKAHEDHRRAMQALNEQKDALQQQGVELEVREEELTNREVELAEMRQQFEQREMDIVQRASGLEQRESKLASQAESLEQQEAEIESRSQEVQRKIAELDAQLAGITRRKGELEKLEEEIKQKIEREDEASRKLELAIEELEQARREMGEKDARVEALSVEMDKLSKQHEQTAAELKSAVSKLRGREIELGERSKALEELAEKAGDIEQELSDVRGQYEQRLGETEANLDKMKEQLTREQQVSTGLRAQIESLEQQQGLESDARVVELQSQLSERQQQLDEAIARVEALEQAGHERSDEDQQRIDTLSSELESARAQLESLTNQLASIGDASSEELDKQREQSHQLQEQLQALQGELEQSKAQRDELQAKLDEGAGTDSEELARVRAELEQAAALGDELRGTIEKRESQLKELAERMTTLEAELEEARASGGASSAELDEHAQKKLESLESQCSDLIATVERLNTELEKAREQSPGQVDDEWTRSRRTRLRRMREILKGDAEKLRLANGALRTRYEQCEQVLTKRAELAEAYEAIATAQRKVRNKEVRSGVFVGLFGLIAIVMMLGVSSWFIAGRVAPGLYNSRATLTANSPDGTLTETDLAEWEVYITELTNDPRFLEVAAERMKRRGIGAFATPGELGTRMGEYLDIAVSMPGELVLEYRDTGSERTQRVLDTFTVALASAANNARARRADAAITSVEETATLSEAPLDTKRLEMTGFVFGGGLLVTMIVGGLLWRRLAAAKARFENDSRVQVLFDEDEAWKMPS
ncbi:MAG: hypothetical protein CMJ35_04255 [Phycisphaerae bacterium]|nr:hypothetical protein [Phycisphaerae bacterium]MBM90812.1 hypothetical protein [Phycisphaerae bacterium]